FKKKDPFHSNMKKPILLLAFLVIFLCMNTSQARSKSKKSRKSSNQTSLLSEQNLRQELTTSFLILNLLLIQKNGKLYLYQ
ncbi:hypothetical protein BpHYR1_049535, partial [Brachionus plicatilis]